MLKYISRRCKNGAIRKLKEGRERKGVKKKESAVIRNGRDDERARCEITDVRVYDDNGRIGVLPAVLGTKRRSLSFEPLDGRSMVARSSLNCARVSCSLGKIYYWHIVPGGGGLKKSERALILSPSRQPALHRGNTIGGPVYIMNVWSCCSCIIVDLRDCTIPACLP